ncbi:hypothetical protein A8709_12890 [Paenibacillus pectinilyticus]|uniref:Cytochrome c domain-containing protein n=1 Tax=Paenibacillus pectinilyticus TaxID=512399 RepID=A0A1C1A364_9BACL|nr:cytochrome c [Paenibacillus pectinilyticus]OCT15011.1 hypothetical protein A8709_12890 [Paenibacillus pectinilyticus]
MNKWIYASLCGMILLSATGCGAKEAAPVASTSATATATATVTTAPTPAAAVTPSPSPQATPALAASASPAAVANSTPKPQATASASTSTAAASTAATPTPTLAAVSSTPTPSPSVTPVATVSPTTSANEKAELLYKNNCLVCHGVGLAGDYGPNLTKVGSRKTKDQIVTQIMNGKVEMPPFKDTLKPEEIEVLANWLATMK